MNIIKTLLAIIITIVLTLTSFIIALDINISNFFTKEEMEQTVENIDISHEINKIQNSSPTGESKAEIADIINFAYKEAENHGISSKLVDEIFNSKETKKFLGQIIGTTTDYIINENKNKNITSKQFNKLLDDNMDKWIKQSNTEISDSKKEVLVIRMKSAAAGVIDNLPSGSTIENKVNSNILSQIRFIFSDKVKLILVAITIISLLLLIIVKYRKGLWLVYSSLGIFLSGVAITSLSFLIGDMITFALRDYNVSFLISAFKNTLSQNIMITGITELLISLILFIIYIIHNKRVNQESL